MFFFFSLLDYFTFFLSKNTLMPQIALRRSLEASGERSKGKEGSFVLWTVREQTTLYKYKEKRSRMREPLLYSRRRDLEYVDMWLFCE